MQLNGLELAAIFKIAKAMAAADGRLDPNEAKVIAGEVARFGVPGTEINGMITASDAMSTQQALVVIAGLGPEPKKYVAAYLGTLMVVDGEIADSEMKLWQLTSTLCGLPTMNVADAVNYMAHL